MDELLKLESWLQALDFSLWTKDEKVLNQWVDLRDSFEFYDVWLPVLDIVENTEKSASITEVEADVIERIMNAAFFKSISANENCELANHVSDDFWLFARAARLHLQNDRLDKLRAEYDAERFQYGAL